MNVVVCGAGIAGLAFAHQASATGHEVVVLEEAPGPRRQGYMMDFWGPGYDAAETMAILGPLTGLDHAIAGVRFVDSAGRSRATLDFASLARRLGGRLITITRAELEQALRDSLRPGVDVRYAAAIAGLDPGADGVRISLANGDMLDADLVVGADGIHSTVRALTFGDEHSFVRQLGFRVAAFSFTDPGISARVQDWYHFTDTIDAGFCLYGLPADGVGVFAVRRARGSPQSLNTSGSGGQLSPPRSVRLAALSPGLSRTTGFTCWAGGPR